MVGNIIFNTRQIYIYRYLKMSIFHISLCKKWLSYYGQTTKNTQNILFCFSCGQTTKNLQEILFSFSCGQTTNNTQEIFYTNMWEILHSSTGQYLWKEIYYLAVKVLKQGKLLNNEIGRSYFHAWSSYVLQFFFWVFSLAKFHT